MMRLRLATAVERDGGALDACSTSGLFERLSQRARGGEGRQRRVEPLIDAYVIDVRATFSGEPGRSSVEVVAMDGSVLLQLEEKVRALARPVGLADRQRDLLATRASTPTWTTRSRCDRAGRGTTIQRGDRHPVPAPARRAQRLRDFIEVGADGRGDRPLPRAAPGRPAAGGAQRSTWAPRRTSTASTPATTCSGRRPRRRRGLRRGQPQATSRRDSQSSRQRALGAQPTVGGGQPRQGARRPARACPRRASCRPLAQAVVDRSAHGDHGRGRRSYGADYGARARAKRPVLVRGAGQQFSGT